MGPRLPGDKQYMSEPRKDLAQLRTEIDAIDRELLAVLNRRAALANEVGDLKRSEGSTVFRPDREAEVINKMNAEHAKKFDGVGKEETVELLKENSTAAAAAIRLFTDNELDQAAPVSLYANAMLTCQFVLEDHAVRHSFHHLGRIRAALQERTLAKLTA